MQTTDKHDLEQRMPYYATGLNKFTLKSSYVLFLCTFDPFGQGESIYEFEFFDKKTRSIEFQSGMHITVLNSKGTDPSLGRDLLNVSHFMNGIISRSDDYIVSLQKDIVSYVDSGKFADEMNKLEYEMNQVALKKGIQDTISFIKALKELGIPRDTALQKVLQISNGELNRNEIEKLMEENY